MEILHYAGTYFHAYICPNHPNELWDTRITSADGAPYCIPCELKNLREENKRLRELADQRSLDNFYLNRAIDKLAKENEELREKAIWCGDDRRR